MKKIIFAICIVAVCITGCAGITRIKHIKPDAPAFEEPSRPIVKFTVGERLTATGAWKGFPIGTGTATIEGILSYKGYEVYKVVVVAKTSGILSKLYKVEDTFISYIDTKNFTSRYFEARRREGFYKKDVVVDYDFDREIATYHNLLDGTVKTCPIAKEVHDPISAAYYFRTVPIKVGDELYITINLNEENYDICGNVEKKSSVTIPDLGTFEALLVKPYVRLKGKRQRRAKSWAYISTGEKRLALYGVIKVLEIPWIGEISGTLRKVEYIGDNLPETPTLED